MVKLNIFIIVPRLVYYFLVSGQHANREDKAPEKNKVKEDVPIQCDYSNVTETQKTELQSLISEYCDMFALKPEELGCASLVEHYIETGNNPPT